MADSTLATRVYVVNAEDSDMAERVYIVNADEFPPPEQGEQGPQGEQGETGPAGPSNVIDETSGPTSLTVGAIRDGEIPGREGSTFVGRVRRTKLQTADNADPGGTGATDITGLSVNLPRAGVYQFHVEIPWSADATNKTIGVGVAYSGTTTRLAAHAFLGTPGGVVNQTAHNTPGTLVTRAGITSTSERFSITGSIKVSTSGDLKVQFSRSAGTMTISGASLDVKEAY